MVARKKKPKGPLIEGPEGVRIKNPGLYPL
jgi:hypothetical protein